MDRCLSAFQRVRAPVTEVLQAPQGPEERVRLHNVSCVSVQAANYLPACCRGLLPVRDAPRLLFETDAGLITFSDGNSYARRCFVMRCLLLYSACLDPFLEDRPGI